jgi:hypothetical protein
LIENEPDNQTVELTGRFKLYLSDFHIPIPDIVIMKLSNEIEVTVNLLLQVKEESSYVEGSEHSQ